MKRLYRCRHDRRIAGVAGGVAEYFELDPTMVRIVWFLSMFFGLVTLVVYIGMAIIVPLEPETAGAALPLASSTAADPGHRHSTGGTGRWTTFVGLALVLFGTVALLDVAIPGLSWRHLWPVFIAGLGVALIAGSFRPADRAVAGAAASGSPAPSHGVVPAPSAEPAAAVADADVDPMTDTTAG